MCRRWIVSAAARQQLPAGDSLSHDLVFCMK
jgi:hypothetical protein